MKNNKKLNKDKKGLDNEIIIGLKPNPTLNKKIKQKNKKETNKNKKKKLTPKRKKFLKIVKWTILLILFAILITMIMLSSLFNVKSIILSGNSKISDQEIINLSYLKINENMFKTLKIKSINNIKTNPYIENVKISKKLNGTIKITVEERNPTYLIELDNGYAYINNQGYILEISGIKEELPLINGITTDIESIKPGNRLNIEDLKKLDVVIQIMKTAEGKNISKLITNIDISNENDYILTLQQEQKVIHFGDETKIYDKMLWIEYAIQENEGIDGILFVKNIEKPYFRSKV